MARDTSQTGAVETAGKWISIDAKKGVFKLPNNQENGTIAVYLDPAPFIIWKDAVQGHPIPARWELCLRFFANFGEGDHQYNLSLSSHWKSPLLSNLVNALLGGLETQAWQDDPENRLCVITLHTRTLDNGMTNTGAFVDMDRNKTDMPMKFKYNESLKKFEGIPEFDWEAPGVHARITRFWMGQAGILVAKLGGHIEYRDVKYKLPSPSASVDQATAWFTAIEDGKGEKLEAGSAPANAPASGTAPTNTAAAAQPSPTAGDWKEGAKSWFAQQMQAPGADIQVILPMFHDLVKQKSATATDRKVLAAWINAEGIKLGWLPLGAIVSDSFGYTPPPPSDDLPF